MSVRSSEFITQFEGESHGNELGIAVAHELRARRVAGAPEPPPRRATRAQTTGSPRGWSQRRTAEPGTLARFVRVAHRARQPTRPQREERSSGVFPCISIAYNGFDASVNHDTLGVHTSPPSRKLTPRPRSSVDATAHPQVWSPMRTVSSRASEPSAPVFPLRDERVFIADGVEHVVVAAVGVNRALSVRVRGCECRHADALVPKLGV